MENGVGRRQQADGREEEKLTWKIKSSEIGVGREWNAEAGGGTELEKGITRLMEINNLGCEKCEAAQTAHEMCECARIPVRLSSFLRLFCVPFLTHHIDYAVLFHLPFKPTSFLESASFLFPERKQLHSNILLATRSVLSSLNACFAGTTWNHFRCCRFQLRDERWQTNKFVRSVSTNLINDVSSTFNYYLNARRRVRGISRRAFKVFRFAHR